MRLHDTPFCLIQDKKKTIEIRINDQKRRSMQPNDQIDITSRATGEVLRATIVQRIEAPTFIDLLTLITLEQAGWPACTTIAQALQDLYQYYDPEEERRDGVVALKITPHF